MRAVADTNAFISALMFGGLPGRFLDLALGRKFTLVTSLALLDELDEKPGAPSLRLFTGARVGGHEPQPATDH